MYLWLCQLLKGLISYWAPEKEGGGLRIVIGQVKTVELQTFFIPPAIWIDFRDKLEAGEAVDEKSTDYSGVIPCNRQWAMAFTWP